MAKSLEQVDLARAIQKAQWIGGATAIAQYLWDLGYRKGTQEWGVEFHNLQGFVSGYESRELAEQVVGRDPERRTLMRRRVGQTTVWEAAK